MITLNIMSIFYSVSGEINMWHQGTPVVFVRLAGCNLNCGYCDTPKSINSKGDKLSIDDIMEAIQAYNCDKVVITGGEPLLQASGLSTLVALLKGLSYQVSIETNGSINLGRLGVEPDCWVVDIKMPGSGEIDKMKDEAGNWRLVDWIKTRQNIVFKIPIESIEDYKASVSLAKALIEYRCTVIYSPVLPLTAAELWDLMGDNKYPINTQIHKAIWPDAGDTER